MEIKPRIYALKNLTPETIAVTFAKCSRSPEPFDEIAKELTEEQSADFNEKWVINYGHSSIAEHAFTNIAIEDVSLIAVETIQANRLGSYTEKSSRYQVYDRERVYTPQVIKDDKALANIYQETVNELFDVYEKSLEPVRQETMKLYPNVDNLPDDVYQGKIKSKWVDVCRFLLPNCVLANLGASMNARSWEYAITKMLSSPLAEVREIGQQVKKVALEITPTLVKFADPNQYYIDNEKYLMQKSNDLLENFEKPVYSKDNEIQVDLIDYDQDAEDKVLTGLIYKYQAISYKRALNRVKKMTQEEKADIFKSILRNAENIYFKPPRELEYPYYTFDVLLDQGAYYDLKRNRIMTQTPQMLNGEYGYFTPEIMVKVGMADEYRRVMDKAHQVCQQIAQKYPYEAQYITTKATARRFIMKMNLREAFYFIGLRSKKQGHFMYRQVAQKVYNHIADVHPGFAKYIDVDFD